MSNSIRVKVVVLGSVVEVELEAGSSIADAVVEARVDSTLEARYRGRVVQSGDYSGTALEDGDTIVFTAPSLKHG